jgi:heme exporter protein D
MTEEKDFMSVKMRLGFAIVLTCLTLIYIFYAVLGVYGFYDPLFFVITLFPVILWVQVAEQEKKLNKQFSKYIQAGLLITICILTMCILYLG